MKGLSYISVGLVLVSGLLVSGCGVRETHRAVQSQTVASYNSTYAGKRAPIVVGKFDNRSTYMQGLFSNNENQVGNQAKSILKTHLQQTNRFALFDRENLANIAKEASISGKKQNLRGARYAITGAVTEFGRKEVGDRQFFGVLGSGKSQIAYSKVSLNIVDVETSEVIYSAQGAGEYAISQREVLGFGSRASYDSTLTAKVLNFAVIEVVNKLVADMESGKLQLN